MPIPFGKVGLIEHTTMSKIETNPIFFFRSFVWIWFVRFFCIETIVSASLLWVILVFVRFGSVWLFEFCTIVWKRNGHQRAASVSVSVSTSWFHQNVRFDYNLYGWNKFDVGHHNSWASSSVTTIGTILRWLFIFQLSLKSLRVLKWLRLIYCPTNEEMCFCWCCGYRSVSCCLVLCCLFCWCRVWCLAVSLSPSLIISSFLHLFALLLELVAVVVVLADLEVSQFVVKLTILRYVCVCVCMTYVQG